MNFQVPLRILLVTPSTPGVENGNSFTARRWAGIFNSLGHHATVQYEYRDDVCDLMVALHAGKSFPSISRFKSIHANLPLVVALTGTDLYRDLGRDTRVEASLRLADRLIALQKDAGRRVPAEHRPKVRVIYQSARVHQIPVELSPDSFQICVLAHLRAEKDPLRAAKAVRDLPTSSRIRVLHAGGALEAGLGRRAEEETRQNSRYQWLGSLPHEAALTLLCRSHLLCIPSRMEGSSNALSEALVNHVPVVASQIAGLEGTLGADYPGYFQPGDTAGLRQLLLRAEKDPEFYRRLKEACESLGFLSTPQREREAWQSLLGEIFKAGRMETSALKNKTSP